MTVVVAVVGLGVARLTGAGDLTDTPVYLYGAYTLLAIGLFGSTHGIDLAEARHELRTVLIAVTLGVLGKAALIAGVMVLVMGDPAYLVLGVAVAQIDPLSVAAMHSRSGMSSRARAILSAWASFDDPITVLLTVYASAIALPLATHAAGSGGGVPVTDGLWSWGASLLGNAVLVLAVWLVWRALGALRPRLGRAYRLVTVAVLLVVVAIAVWQMWMLGLAAIGLFYRPGIGRHLDRLASAAFLLAVFALGMLLTGGIEPGLGIILGGVAFAAQALAACVIARRLNSDDRVHLALGQQNGITAIILALTLQPDFPRTIAIVAPAILVVNVLNIAGNGWWERHLAHRASGRRPPVTGHADPARRTPRRVAPQTAQPTAVKHVR